MALLYLCEGADMKLYVAYGSNLCMDQMAVRCPTAEFVCTGEIENYELQFRGARGGAFATIVPHRGARVPVAIWSLQSQDEAKLDRYEGYPSHYFKRDVEVSLGTDRVTAMAYIMQPYHDINMPSPYYLAVVREGYRDCGLDLSYLAYAFQQSRDAVYHDLTEQEQEMNEIEEGGIQL